MNRDRFERGLTFFEGRKLFPYLDTAKPPRITIGVGRNLTDKGISFAESEVLLDNDRSEVEISLETSTPWWMQLDDVRQRVLADMRFNMGPGFLQSWPIFLGQVRRGEWEAAARNMESTRWYRQVGRRGPILVRMMRTGQDSDRF